jgi:hypothetical protein
LSRPSFALAAWLCDVRSPFALQLRPSPTHSRRPNDLAPGPKPTLCTVHKTRDRMRPRATPGQAASESVLADCPRAEPGPRPRTRAKTARFSAWARTRCSWGASTARHCSRSWAAPIRASSRRCRCGGATSPKAMLARSARLRVAGGSGPLLPAMSRGPLHWRWLGHVRGGDGSSRLTTIP